MRTARWALAALVFLCFSQTVQAQPAMPTVGILAIEAWPPIESFKQGMKDLGYVEGKNLKIEPRYAEGRNERFPYLARELVTDNVSVILTWGTEPTLAAKRATTKIPIVMGAIGDPIAVGVVTNLAKPGGNITGLSALTAALESKRLELLKEIVPNAARAAVLSNPTNRYSPAALENVRESAKKLNVALTMYEARDATSLDAALEALATSRPDGLLVLGDPFLVGQRRWIGDFTLKRRIPSVYTYAEHAEAGGLAAYAPSYHDLFRRAATYVDKILKGAKPGDLPIEQAAKFELIVNVKTARALGLTVPRTVLVRADRIIE
jgi:putative ABC transport system substrate-binding protein